MGRVAVVKRLFLGCALLLAGCDEHADAQRWADAWIKEQGLNARADCTRIDSDGDGYLSCTLVVTDPDGRKHIEPLECAGRYTLNTGCRYPKMSIRGAK